MDALQETAPLNIGSGDIGVVMCHGFTGSPASVAPWAEHLARRGDVTVIVPRLNGHGTTWQDMRHVGWTAWVADVEAAFTHLSARCSRMVVAGLSMGGALALRLAELHPVDGILLVNPAIASRDRALAMTGILHHVVGSQPGIASDIALEGRREPAYEKVSVRAAWQMTRLWDVVRTDLWRVRAPVKLWTSRVDHVVDDLTAEILLRELPSVDHVVLENSFHVATLDHDAPLIEQQSSEFLDHVAGGQATRRAPE